MMKYYYIETEVDEYLIHPTAFIVVLSIGIALLYNDCFTICN